MNANSKSAQSNRHSAIVIVDSVSETNKIKKKETPKITHMQSYLKKVTSTTNLVNSRKTHSISRLIQNKIIKEVQKKKSKDDIYELSESRAISVN
jgi:hypothetical protein